MVRPSTPALQAAVAAHQALRRSAGGDPALGRRLGSLVRAAGFVVLDEHGRYEEDLGVVGTARYIGARLRSSADDDPDVPGLVAALEAWAATPGATFAQRWVSVVARGPS